MSVRIKKRIKLLDQTINIFEDEGVKEFIQIETSISSIKKSLSKIVNGNKRSGKELNDILAGFNELDGLVEQFKSNYNSNLDKLIKDYNWLKNKFDILDGERKNFKSLYELASHLENETDLESLLQIIIDSITKIIDAEYGILELIDDDGKAKAFKNSGQNDNSFILEMKEKVLETSIKSGSSIIMNNLIVAEANGNKGKFASVMCLPLKSDDAIIGIIFLGVYRKSFTGGETELIEELEPRISRAIANNIKYGLLVESRQKMLAELRANYDFDEVIGDSPQIATLLSIVADIADSNTAILIEGESGTGKEVIAKAIHKNSSRRDKPFIPINCSAIPENLLESELFGYERGAFTGAIARKPGKFEQANGGTILLDEIGELPLSLQVKLLRFLQSHEFELLGSNEVIKSDIRIITATKRDLSQMVEAGEFRDDLYYRINVININTPALRERASDIHLLADHFINLYNNSNEKEIRGISNDALSLLEKYDYPGNVRELENLIERAVVLCKNSMIGVDDLPDKIRFLADQDNERIPQNSKQLRLVKKKILDESVGTVERDFVVNALRKARGNISEASRLTQMHRKQFQRLMNRHNLNVQDIGI